MLRTCFTLQFPLKIFIKALFNVFCTCFGIESKALRTNTDFINELNQGAAPRQTKQHRPFKTLRKPSRMPYNRRTRQKGIKIRVSIYRALKSTPSICPRKLSHGRVRNKHSSPANRGVLASRRPMILGSSDLPHLSSRRES